MGRQLLSQSGEPLWAVDERLRRLQDRLDRLSTTVETFVRTVPAACGNAVDDWFLRRHLPAPDAYVVDVGCGTGEFAARLADLVPQGQVIGVEPDGPMLALARTRQRPNLRFVAGCAEDLHLAVPPASADLVVSRAARDEVPLAGSPRCLASAHTVLRPAGWLHIECGGAGHIRHVRRILDAIATDWGLPARASFPDAGTAYDLVTSAGFEVPDGGVLTVARRRVFHRDQLLALLLTHAAGAYLTGASDEVTRGFRQAVSRSIDELANPDGSYDQTLVRLDVLARRPRAAGSIWT